MKTTLTLFALAILLSIPFLFIKGPLISSVRSESHFKPSEDEGEAFGALTFLSKMNAFPNKDIPPDGYSIAWIKHKEMLALAKEGGTRTAWENVGPTNIGGRTISVAIDPSDTSVVWLGSASGGLWKSTSGGIGISAWTYVPTGFPVLGVGSVVINPSNSQEMFIGTGETYAYNVSDNGLDDRTTRGSFGIGILKSIDAGVTWSLSLDWTYQETRGVWDIQYNPLNTNILYAATTEGVYKSTDAGTTWNNVLDKLMVTDLEVDPVDTNIVYAGVGNQGSPEPGIYKTSDGGTTWTLLTGNGLPSSYSNDGRITVSLYKGDHNIVMALIANEFSTYGIYRSEDGGITWTLKSTEEIVTYQGWFAKGLLIKSNDPAKVLAGGVDVFLSNNSGSNFSSLGFPVHADIHEIISNPLDAEKIYIVTDGGLYRSNHFSESFFSCTDGYVTSQHYIGSVSASNPDLVLSGLQDNNTIRFTGTNDWEGIIGGDGSYNAIDPYDDNVEYGSSQYLNIYKTVDQWMNTFDQIYYSPSFPTGAYPAAFLAPFILCRSNTDVLYAGNTTLLKTTNAGVSFFPTLPDPVDFGNHILSIEASATNSDTVYFATAPTQDFPMHVYRSIDGGFSTTDISFGLPNRYPRRIAVNPGNSSQLYVIFSGFNGAPGGHIYKSEDAGTTWMDISLELPDLPFHCLAIDPLNPNSIYAGCDFTVYSSVDGGQSWSSFAEALPEAVMVFDLVISPADHTLYAFTHGHGVFRASLLDIGASVENANTSMEISVYPNPSADKFTVKWNAHEDQPVAVALYNSSGTIIFENIIPYSNNKSLSINVSAIPLGNYLMVVKGKKNSQAKKVTVIH